MLVKSQFQIQRRGIVLVLVLAMLGLLALVGVTFATFAGQSRINARNFAQSLIVPQDDELMDFALSQLINDTGDPRSAIRGHSMARDMYGNDSNNNGYLQNSPTTGAPFQITAISAPSVGATNYTYTITTSIASNDVNFYGYDFTRWLIRMQGSTVNNVVGTVSQTFEILFDSKFNASSSAGRQFTIVIGPNDGLPSYNQTNGYYIPVPLPISSTNTGTESTTLLNPTTGQAATALPGAAIYGLAGTTGASSVPANFPFQLDGRWLRAFNGPGMGANALYGNFRYNGALLAGNAATATSNSPGDPSSWAMDEDYDACDLENWYLAIQSADGQVMIPSFHRPAIIRNDSFVSNPATVNDWTGLNPFSSTNPVTAWADSASRILRPRQIDNPQFNFPDLVPNSSTGQIPYDVDNDGDGTTDSVWLDLGYPVRRDSRGQLYKPLFAFMVIGLNGRIPLNTAGNLAGTAAGIELTPGTAPTVYAGAAHSLHLGNSPSEIDPTYALQNGFSTATMTYNGNNYSDTVGAFSPPQLGVSIGTATTFANNTQVDTAGIDVRLTQLRNLLAGTRPQSSPASPNATTNGDMNYVFSTATSGAPATTSSPAIYYMPNGIADSGDSLQSDANTGLPYVVRTTQPVPGRWGKAQSIPGMPIANPAAVGNPALPALVNVVGQNWGNPVRAGYSLDIGDIMSGVPRDAADDNYNSFDPYPVYEASTGNLRTGELGDADSYDVAGALIFPVERIRRWLTPADINGTGSVSTWNPSQTTPNRGPDVLGRVEFSSYFRPPGAPGAISTNYTVYHTGSTPPYTGIPATTNGTNLGAIYFPETTHNASDPFYTSGPTNYAPAIAVPLSNGGLVNGNAAAQYLPDMTNNPLHGYESFRIPNQAYTPTSFMPQQLGGAPTDENSDTTTGAPTQYPTYDRTVNASTHSDGLNEADEMNLYNPNPLLDSPFGAGDLEWLYRQQDVDGGSLTSRLSSLAPISFTNMIDGVRRRRLFALDAWEPNNFVWANDNPGNAFPNNSRFGQNQSASFQQAGLGTPPLAQRDKKINLNFPLPVSNDPNEPVRQKWINDTYQLLKAILPPMAVDTPEELAQLSQYVINIIDFRDPDATMTHWVNPDVLLENVLPGTDAPTTSTPVPMLVSANSSTANGTTIIVLDQYGMEYNPVAINEVLAYSFQYYQGGGQRANRFFAELVSTLTSPELMSGSTFVPTLDLGGFSPQTATNGAPAPDPYASGSWDIVFTGDDPYSRPDPYRGQLLPYGNFYAPTPLNGYSFQPLGAAPYGSDVNLMPLWQGNTPANGGSTIPGVAPVSAINPAPTLQGAAVASDYFYAFGNAPPIATAENGTPSPTTPLLYPYTSTTYNDSTYATPASTTPSLVQTLTTTADPVTGTSSATAPVNIYPGVLPNVTVTAVTGNPNPSTTTLPANSMSKLPPFTTVGSAPVYYWVCLRRPANPFAPVSQANPMVVVDSMRFPYIDGMATSSVMPSPPITGTGAPPTVPAQAGANPTGGNVIYSVQRFQPYRGGHAVPVPQVAPTTPAPVDTRYGFTEQIVMPTVNNIVSTGITQGVYYMVAGTGGTNTYYYATQQIYHTLGWANEFEQGSTNPLAEPWDYFPFNDRDFTSVAELMLVPGCPPGLFTKQFVEFAPSYANVTNIFGAVTPFLSAPVQGPSSGATGGATSFLSNTGGFGTTSTTPTYVQPYNTASTPLSVTTGYTAVGSNPTTAAPVQPHTFPYLIDKFFYSGYGASNTLDPGGLVGGYAADGWFKMFDFFEVPSQTLGAIGPVASGMNFDWARQDSRHGLLNINLIIDEEVFFSVVGRQSISQSNGQLQQNINGTLTAVDASDQFVQTNLNFDQIMAATAPNGITPALPGGNYIPLGNAIPIATDPNTASASSPFLLPLDPGTPPIPLVVTSTLASGAPASAYPLWNPNAAYGGVLDNDPIYNGQFNTSILQANGNPPVYTNALKAAWIQFLWLRHGGSGYMFGYGNGPVGSNVSIQGNGTISGANGAAGSLNPLPAETPFRSLSFPDIDHTVMRPAALPPGVFVASDGTATYYTNPNANPLPTTLACTLYGTAAPAAGIATPWNNPSTYGTVNPVTETPLWNSFAGDPGVRNYYLYSGYPSAVLAATPGILPAGWTMNPATTFLGYPGAATPAPPSPSAPSPPSAVAPPANTYWPVYPPPIPVRRLFQIPDAYNPNAGILPTAALPSASNASETGDPSLNLLTPIPNPPAATTFTVPMPAPGALPPISYPNAGIYGVLTNSVANLYWPGANAAYMYSGTAGAPPTPVPLPNGLSGNSYYGSAASSTGGVGGIPRTDTRQHPYWRTEHLQRIMNQTTVRTHQYAVWVTVGFFEVTKQGDLGMLSSSNPQLAFDTIGAEVGAVSGSSVRYRGFFLVDRTKLTGFNPNNTGSFRQAVVYRKVIQ